MANQIAIVQETIPLLLNSMKFGTPQKTKVYTDSKTVRAISLRFVFSNPAFSATVPVNKKNSIFIVTG